MKRFLIPSFIAAGLVAPQDNSFALPGVGNNIDQEAEKEESILNFRLPFVAEDTLRTEVTAVMAVTEAIEVVVEVEFPEPPLSLNTLPQKVTQHRQKVSCRKLNPIPNSIQIWF